MHKVINHNLYHPILFFRHKGGTLHEKKIRLVYYAVVEFEIFDIHL